MNEHFLEYMQKSAGVDGYTNAEVTAAKNIYEKNRPGSTGLVASALGKYVANTSPGEVNRQGMRNAQPIPKGLSNAELLAKRNLVAEQDKSLQRALAPSDAEKTYGADVKQGFKDYIGGGKDATWLQQVGGYLSGSQNNRAQRMQNLITAANKNPAIAKQIGMGQKSWSPVQNQVSAEALKGTAAVNLPAETRKAQSAALSKLWTDNKGWMIPAGIGVGGLGILMTMLMGGGGQKQQQQPININVGGAPQRWQSNRNWTGYNYRPRV